MENVSSLLFPAIVVGALIFVIYRFSRYGGIVGLMYGKRHEKVGEFSLRSRISRSKFILYRLEGDSIGTKGDLVLELRSASVGSIQSFPFRLTETDLKELRDLLDEALS